MKDDVTLDRYVALARTPVATVMSRRITTVEPHTELAVIAALMIDRKIGAIPVVGNHTAALVGIVSYADVLRAMTR
jgi:CBS domain-containing protein